MTQGGYFAAAPPPKPAPPRADLAISIVALVCTVLFGGASAAGGLLALAFMDSCPPQSCSPGGAVTAVMSSLTAAFVIGAIGFLVTVVQLCRRKPGWPFAIATLVLCVAAVGCGVVGYVVAVGA